MKRVDPDEEFWEKRKAQSRTNYQETLERLCRLQQRVSRAVFDGSTANDCFCKQGGFWSETYDPVASGSWSNSGRVLEFIESAVERAIEQYDFDKAESQPHCDD